MSLSCILVKSHKCYLAFVVFISKATYVLESDLLWLLISVVFILSPSKIALSEGTGFYKSLFCKCIPLYNTKVFILVFDSKSSNKIKSKHSIRMQNALLSHDTLQFAHTTNFFGIEQNLIELSQIVLNDCCWKR
jgi:hypothetical protein